VLQDVSKEDAIKGAVLKRYGFLVQIGNHAIETYASGLLNRGFIEVDSPSTIGS
jgi:hypothetical protein